MLDTLQKSLIQQLDKLRAEAQQKESEADKLIRDTIIGLEKWDKKTEQLVSQLHEARDNHVSVNDKSSAYLGVRRLVQDKFVFGVIVLTICGWSLGK